MQEGQDRQDTTSKGTWWAITAYNEDIDLLEGVQTGTREWPSHWKKVLGGKESCPDTGRLHFQGALNTASIRFSQVKSILGQSNIQKADRVWALKRYVMKSETAAGEKREASNTTYVSLEGFMELIAERYSPWFDTVSGESLSEDNGYWHIVREIVYDKPFLANLATQPQSIRCWRKLGMTFVRRYKDFTEKSSP